MNGGYCCFHPHDLPFDHICSSEVASVMSEATIELARLDGMLRLLDDDTIRMLSTNLSLVESTFSSSIEGTRSTVEDVFRSEREEEKDEIRARDNREIVNYRRALVQGFDELSVGGQLDVEVIKRLHRTLMESVCGYDRSPGEFKEFQNAIGTSRDAIDDWLLFLAEGLRVQAISAARAVEGLIGYRNRLNGMAEDLRESKVVGMLFVNPYITSRDIVETTGMSAPTANKILKRFESVGILREVTGRERNRLYCADAILEILRW